MPLQEMPFNQIKGVNDLRMRFGKENKFYLRQNAIEGKKPQKVSISSICLIAYFQNSCLSNFAQHYFEFHFGLFNHVMHPRARDLIIIDPMRRQSFPIYRNGKDLVKC